MDKFPETRLFFDANKKRFGGDKDAREGRQQEKEGWSHLDVGCFPVGDCELHISGRNVYITCVLSNQWTVYASGMDCTAVYPHRIIGIGDWILISTRHVKVKSSLQYKHNTGLRT